VFEQFLSEHRTYEEALKAARKAIQSHNGQDRKIVVDRVAEYDPRRERAPTRVYIIGQGVSNGSTLSPTRKIQT
jgi:hypothetical protein